MEKPQPALGMTIRVREEVILKHKSRDFPVTHDAWTQPHTLWLSGVLVGEH